MDALAGVSLFLKSVCVCSRAYGATALHQCEFVFTLCVQVPVEARVTGTLQVDLESTGLSTGPVASEPSGMVLGSTSGSCSRMYWH